MRTCDLRRLLAAATVLLVLAACGGDDAAGPPVSRPSTTVGEGTDTSEATTTSRPPATTERTTTTREPITTEPPATTEAPTTTTTEAPATTERTTTTREPITTEAPATTEEPTTTEAPEEDDDTDEAAADTAPETTLPLEPASDDGSMSGWAWVLVGLLVALAVVLLAGGRRRGRDKRMSWQAATDRAVNEGRLVVDELSWTGARPVDEPALQRRLHTLAATLTSLQPDAPTDACTQATQEARNAVADLDAAVAADIRLRIGPPAPTRDQLGTSNAVIAQRARDLGAALDRLATTTAVPA